MVFQTLRFLCQFWQGFEEIATDTVRQLVWLVQLQVAVHSVWISETKSPTWFIGCW
jgi:hypothetical protein